MKTNHPFSHLGASRSVLILLMSIVFTGVVAQPDETSRQGMQRMSCTSIMVGCKASADGSVMTSHTCDSWYRTWMQIVPSRDYKKDTVTAIYDGIRINI